MDDAELSRRRRPTDEELLEELRRLLATRGKLTASLIEASDLTRYPNVYIVRFGSLMAAYERIGYQPNKHQFATSARYRKPEDESGR